MSSHAKAAKKFIADKERTAWHDQALYFVREKRDKMANDVPEWEALREMASQMKRHTISNLGYYLDMFERTPQRTVYTCIGRRMPRSTTVSCTGLFRNMGGRIW